MPSGVVAKKITIGQVIGVRAKASVAAHAHTLRGGRHGSGGGDDEGIAFFVRAVAVLRESSVLADMDALGDLGHGEPAELNEAEEGLAAQHAVVLLWIAHVPVRRDERG